MESNSEAELGFSWIFFHAVYKISIILPSQESLPVVQKAWLLEINWRLVSQPDINAVASNLMRSVHCEWLRDAYQLGLTFDSDCVLSDSDAFYKRYSYRCVMTEPNHLIRGLHLEFVTLFRELGTASGCFATCYLREGEICPNDNP